MYIFIKVATTGDYTFLVKTGHPSQAQLKDAWDSIVSEYAVLSESKQSNYLLTLLREFYTIPNRLAIIQLIVDMLKETYSAELVERLRMLGFRHKYDPENEAQFMRDLKMTVTQAKSLVVRYETVKQDLEKLTKDGEEAQPNEYDAILSEMSRYQGYRLNPKEISIAEFCAIVKNFKRDNKPKK